jgi:hypothetical protein
MFAALCLHGLISLLWDILCGKAANSSSYSDLKKRRTGVSVCYYAAIIVIVAMYSARTIERNPEWLNDSTLHVSSLSVCSRSAKLNLQVSTPSSLS